MLRGTVLRIEQASIYDGEGLRTVVFLKGCPMRCLWCSTPESQSEAIETAPDGTVYGKIMTVPEVMSEIKKDEIFYFHSGGGVTISGGEPLLQAEFTAAILRESSLLGINTAIETSLCLPFERLSPMLPYLSTVFADIKHAESAEHGRLCGLDNAIPLDNLRRLSENAAQFGYSIIARLPLIPGVNDDEANLRAAGELCASLPGISALQLLPYHRLGLATYKKLGREYALPDVKPPSAEHMERCKKLVKSVYGKVI